jgi:hypothetical protein
MATVLDRLLAALDWLFGCHHSRLSWAFTLRGRTYRVCCDCGREFDFSWETLSARGKPHDGNNRKAA